jgi:hypothetical protein
MMNDETEQFERRLSRQSLRQIPAGWRGEILAAANSLARRSGAKTARPSWLSTLNHSVASSQSLGGAGGGLDFHFHCEFFDSR